MLVTARVDQGPRNVGAPVGSNVQLKCRFHHRSCDNMQWTRLDQQRETVSLYTLGRMFESYGGRYSVNVSARGECTLHINRLELSDAGKFTCMEIVPGAPQVRKLATVTVIGMYGTYICFTNLVNVKKYSYIKYTTLTAAW